MTVRARRRTTTGPLALLALAVFTVPAASVDALAQVIDETRALKVKAAYLYNFAKFVTWPKGAFDSDKAPLVIGVLGRDPFGRILDDTVQSKTVRGRRIEVRRLKWNREEDRKALPRCHVLFVCTSERGRLDDVLVWLNRAPVLVVGDDSRFAARGGMIGLVLDRGRIVFEINREAVERADLKASAKLLKLARTTRPKAGRESADSRKTRRYRP
ncbi:MAG: YfiR family protein [Phycisphaerae bacterium]